jgi:transglutaminase-like putative cysteine protease
MLGLWFGGLGWAASLPDFFKASRDLHGADGEAAARFLAEHMTEADRTGLSNEFLLENLDLAFRARKEFPWAAKVPEAIFLNDVLPYAVFDETRDPWRAELLALSRDVVKDARTASAAAQALNRELFKRVNVHYNTGRKRPNQSLRESKALGKATCTGLSIILVEACRSVGIPARAVGTPMWTNERGNHTWVEVWDGDWHFAGADEYDAGGLDRGWFVGDASKARANEPRHAIYATSWKRDGGLSFPMVWARNSTDVPAVNVTARYARSDAAPVEIAALGVRLWDRTGGSRIAAKVCVLDGVRRSCALADTKAGRADLNDMPRFSLAPGAQGWLRFTVGTDIREMAFGPLAAGDSTVDARWEQLTPASPVVDALREWLDLPEGRRSPEAEILTRALSRPESERVLGLVAADRLARLAADRTPEVEKKELAHDGKTLRWLEKEFGKAPAGQRSLWISMHGGGGAPKEVNDRQWQNQIRLYEPAEGFYVAPRAPTDTWNLWHEGHIDPMFQRLIDDYVAVRGVSPDRVYLMGYSAGGDGVWQLAPRMADRFAAASMMAGHPNEASLLGLRNLPFAIFMGGNDAAYNRNRIAAERGAELDRLAREDAGGYVHQVRIYEGLGHWMNKKDAEGVPWMAGFVRKAWPTKVVWQQDDVVHRRFYWLQVPAEVPIGDRARLVARVEGQAIVLEGDVPPRLRLRLSDRLLDLDQPVRVVANGQERFSGKVTRQARAMLASLEERADPVSAASAWVDLH